MENIGITTDNFYKFTCTLSLIMTIYCFSFDSIFLDPYNKTTTELNVEQAQLASKIGYLKGVSMDLNEIVEDSIKNGHIEYFYYNKIDSSEHVKYYSNVGTSQKIKKIVDSLNRVNKDYANNLFKSKAIKETQNTLEHNIKIKEYVFWTLGVISLLTFIFSLIIWHKNRKEIDK